MQHQSDHQFRATLRPAQTASVIINGKFLAAGPTGVHRVAHELLRALKPGGAAPDDRFEALAPVGNMPTGVPDTVRVNPVGRLTGQLWEQLELPRAARGRTILSLCNLAPMAARNAVTMIHDAQVFITPESYTPAFRAWYRLVMQQVGRRHRRILTVSEFSKAQLVRYRVAAPDRIEVIHNGVDHILRTRADAAILSRLGVTPHTYAVALANTQKHKNIGLLLRTFARPEMADLSLVLVGGATRAAFEALGHEVPANVLFAGPVPDAALRGLIEHALCLAFPSRTEGFGLPPVEAMLLGCPAVIAPCGALPEVCGPAAVTADPDSPAAWSAAMEMLRDDRAGWSSRSTTGRRHAATFTWDRAARQLTAVLAAVTRDSTD